VLSKQVCKHCKNSTVHNKYGEASNRMWVFDKIVWCPLRKKGGARHTDVEKPPPEWCQYQLEHLMKTQR